MRFVRFFLIFVLLGLCLGGSVGHLAEVYCGYSPPVDFILGLILSALPVCLLSLFIAAYLTHPNRHTMLLTSILVLPFAAICTTFGLKAPESKYVFDPLIDTVFADGFSESKFQAINQGMEPHQVEMILGQPFYRQQSNKSQVSDYDEIWYYTNDGGLESYDYAWLRKQVNFKNKIVERTVTGWSCD